MFPLAWSQYRQGFREVRCLIQEAERLASTSQNTYINIYNQQIFLRSAIILLAGHVEYFLKSLIEEFADNLSNSWDSLTYQMKKYTIVQIRDHLQKEFNKEKCQNCNTINDIEFIRQKIYEVYGWLLDPSVLANSPNREKLEYFYRGTAPEAIDRLLRNMRTDGVSFFVWIEHKGFDRSRFWTVLSELVKLRIDIVHRGSMNSPTINDARLYLATATLMVRQIRLFLS